MVEKLTPQQDLALLKEATKAFSDAVLVDRGHYGLTCITPEDGRVIKAFFRSGRDDHLTPFKVLESMELETAALAALAQTDFGPYQIPRLVEPLQELPGDRFRAYYAMTKISGLAPGWDDPLIFNGRIAYKKDSPEQREHFRQAGELLGLFHKNAGAKLEHLDIPEKGRGGHIPQVPALDNDTNRALAIADDYMQAHKQGGIIHGDFYGNNILADDSGNIHGLIDFGLLRRTSNKMIDAVRVPVSVFPDFREGYEQASGQTLDRFMVNLTSLGLCAYSLVNDSMMPDRREGLTVRIHDELDALSAAGFNFSAS